MSFDEIGKWMSCISKEYKLYIYLQAGFETSGDGDEHVPRPCFIVREYDE